MAAQYLRPQLGPQDLDALAAQVILKEGLLAGLGVGSELTNLQPGLGIHGETNDISRATVRPHET